MTVILETERLFLRELLLNDVDPLAAILSSADVSRHIGGPRDANSIRQWIHQQHQSYREKGYGCWAVIHRDSATLIGQAGLTPALVCELDAPYWRLGLGKEILTAVRDHAFEKLNLDGLTAKIPRKHKAGKKLAEAIGMHLEKDEDPLVYTINRAR